MKKEIPSASVESHQMTPKFVRSADEKLRKHPLFAFSAALSFGP
jgi:hypothetical protein